MIIDTNGFETGDKVWYLRQSYSHYYVEFDVIESFNIRKDDIVIIGLFCNKLNEDSYIFHTEQECQLACDKLNLKTEI